MIWAVDPQSEGGHRVLVDDNLDLIVALDLRSGGQKPCIPLRGHAFAYEPPTKTEIEPAVLGYC